MRLGSLTPAQRRSYDAAVSGSHSRRIEALLTDLDGKKVQRDLSEAYLGGSLQGDAGRVPAEVFECQVFDPDGELDWKHGRHRHFRLRIIDYRFVPDIGDGEWVEEVGFDGPLWDFSADSGGVAKLVAHGGEVLASGSVRKVFTRPRKARALDTARDLLMEAGAKNWQVRIPRSKAKLPKAVTIGVKRGKDRNKKKKGKQQRTVQILRADITDTYFGVADRIVSSANFELYWDRGVFRVARAMSNPALSLSETSLLAPVQSKRGDEGETVNEWVGVGHKRPKGKGRPHDTVRLTKHPAAAGPMGWNNTPRQVTERVELNHARKKKDVTAVLKRKRKAARRELLNHEVQLLPVRSWLRPNSLASVPTPQGRVRVRVKQWTIPYSTGADAMTIGANRMRSK